MNRAYLSLGTNIDPETNLLASVGLLGGIGVVTRVSSVWETAPVGFTEQENFLNAVVLLETKSALADLFDTHIPEIENRLGRIRGKNKFGPRSIDIDIILYNRFVGEYEGHELPSDEIEERAFVAVPLAEIAPEEVHPILNITFQQIASGFEVNPEQMKQLPEIDLRSRAHTTNRD